MFHITINGQAQRLDLDGKTPLLSVLREELGLSGPKFGCGQGSCGACMVLVDGQALTACDLPLWAVDGKDVRSIEGLGTPEQPHPLQRAILDERAGQCGYCLPGIMVSAAALLSRQPRPTREDICAALDRNLCRCGTHVRIIRAIERVAAHSDPQAPAPPGAARA